MQRALFGSGDPSFDAGLPGLRRSTLSEGAWFEHHPSRLDGHQRVFDELARTIDWKRHRRMMCEREVIPDARIPRQTPGMFVIELEYIADLSEIDARMPDHVAWLKQHYAAGHFLVSGRKVPRDGGIILAVGESREQIEGFVQADPFVTHGLARFRVIEFRASQRAKNIDRSIA